VELPHDFERGAFRHGPGVRGVSSALRHGDLGNETAGSPVLENFKDDTMINLGPAEFGTDDGVEFNDAEAMGRHIAKLFLRGSELDGVGYPDATAEHNAIFKLRHVP
jgi:hypothetical protein